MQSPFSNVSSFFAIGRRVTWSIRFFREADHGLNFRREEKLHELDVPLQSDFDYQIVKFCESLPLLTWEDGTPVLTESQLKALKNALSFEYSIEILDFVAAVAKGNLE